MNRQTAGASARWGRKRRVAVGFLLSLSFLAQFAGAAATEPASGTVVDSSNWQQLENLLPPPVLEWVKRGEFIIRVGKLEYEPAWDQPFLEASKANDGRFDADADGNLIERRTGTRPANTYGFPFPHIDPQDPKAGIEVMWNSKFLVFKWRSLVVPFTLEWIGETGFERRVRGAAKVMMFDGQPQPRSVTDETELRDIFQATGPASVEGLSVLTWRYRNERPDSVWAYVPGIRRIRQQTAANRTDPLFGSDLVQDDSSVWGGKNQSFEWKLIGSQDVLIPTTSEQTIRLVPGLHGENGQEWKTPVTFPGARIGWEKKGWTGAPWAPTDWVWVPRPVWVIEGFPKDPYYAYGRQIFYVDRSTYTVQYKVVYTRAGEYWKTVFNDFGTGETPDGRLRFLVNSAVATIDEHTRHASYALSARAENIAEINSARLRPELFTVSGLLRLGK